MLYSFQKHNPWFKGDIIIIHDHTLNEEDKDLVDRYFSVKWISIDEDLKEKTSSLSEFFPDFKRRMGQFYSLEAFKLDHYRKILFLDSDILIRGSMEPLLDQKDKLIVCKKSDKYRNPQEPDPDIPFSVEQFNAGMMVIDRSLLGKEIYGSMLDLVKPDFFYRFLEKDEAGQWIIGRLGTDQLIFNTLYQHIATYVSMKYNYRFGISDAILAKEGLAYRDAIVVHFTGKRKPWFIKELALSSRRKNFEAQAYKDWYGHFIELLEPNSIKY